MELLAGQLSCPNVNSTNGVLGNSRGARIAQNSDFACASRTQNRGIEFTLSSRSQRLLYKSMRWEAQYCCASHLMLNSGLSLTWIRQTHKNVSHATRGVWFWVISAAQRAAEITLSNSPFINVNSTNPQKCVPRDAWNTFLRHSTARRAVECRY
jgi:hypothetical protein